MAKSHQRSVSREATPSLEQIASSASAFSRETALFSCLDTPPERPASALSVSSYQEGQNSSGGGGIKLRISFRGGSGGTFSTTSSLHVSDDSSSASSFSGGRFGAVHRQREPEGEPRRRRRLYEELNDEEDEEGARVKKRRPRENIPQRSDMLHNSVTRDGIQ
jgi:hypothetical protein